MTSRLHLFGVPALVADGAATALPFERRSQLVAYLALKRAWVGRAELAALLWPEQETRLAYANLRKTLFRLQDVHWGRPIEADGGALRLQLDCDVVDFDTALAGGDRAAALALRTGELLRGFDDDANPAWTSWLQFERERLRQAWRTAALEALDAIDGSTADRLGIAAQLLADDPLDEAAVAAQLTLLERAGQGAQARRVYDEYAQRLRAELGIEPSSALQALRQGAAPAPAVVGRPATPPDDGFVGRTAELQYIERQLGMADCRVVSVVGPGGAGKTRLARRAVAAAHAAFRDGAAFVALEDVQETAGIALQLARELGLPPRGRGDPLDQVIEALRAREMLLALDNFEQLVGDASAAAVERLLDGCPRVKLLVTSRVRPALRDEWLLPLDGLPCPDADDLDRVDAFDAARVFINAARRAEPALVPAAEAAAIVEICRRVDGLPLALELAAAWTRVLSCEAIAAELARGAELLQAQDAARPQRHASIEVVFEQSWQRLAPGERAALARLALFRGGFTPAAARAVAEAALPVLGALADKSLVRKEGARLYLHPLVQQLAALRLDAPARAATAAAHARYFHRLMAQRRWPVELGAREAMQEFDLELENCRAAWRWASEHGADELLASAAPTLQQYCDHRSRFDDGLALLRLAVPGALARGNGRLAGMLLARAAHLEYRLDRYEDAQRTVDEALRVGADDEWVRVYGGRVLGTVFLRLGRLDEARAQFQAVQAMPYGQEDSRTRAAVASGLALIEKLQGRFDASQRLSVEALTLQRRDGDVAGEALSLNNLAALQMEQQRTDAALEYLKQALELCDRHGLTLTRGFVLSNLSGVAVLRGDFDGAEPYARRALEHAQATGNRALISFLEALMVRFALHRNALGPARAHLRTALAVASELRRPPLLMEAMVRFCELLAALDAVDCARAVAGFLHAHPDLDAPSRVALREIEERWPAATAPAWPGLSLDELVHRIVVESDLGYAALIATLRGR